MSAPQPAAGAAVKYSQQYRRCGRPGCPSCTPPGRGHGPYWYAYWWEGGRARSRYLGKQAPTAASTLRPAPAVWGLRVQTLGGFTVWRDGAEIPPGQWGRRKVAALFKCLLSAPGYRLHREELVELLFPDAEPAEAAKRLRSTLHLLRKVLDRPDAPASHLQSQGDLLALLPVLTGERTTDWLDADAFDRAAAESLAGRNAARCRAALALYGGEYLPGDRYEDWAERRREELRGRHLALLLHLAHLSEAAGEGEETLRCLRTVLTVEPCHEDAARELMALLTAQGRRGEALEVYRALARAMADDLGTAPGPEIQRLRAQLAAGEPAGAARAPRIGAATLPGGTVTLLLSDVEGSTALWEQQPAAMQAAMARHDALFADLLAYHGGHQVKARGEGDSIFAVFARPRAAVAAACALQQAFLTESWPDGASLRVRMGLHSGEVGLREGDYYGSTVNRAARIRGLGHGGQVLLSQATADLVRDALPEGVGLRALGSYPLQGLERPEEIYQLSHPSLPAEFAPLRGARVLRSNLPAALTSFVGRGWERAEVAQLLRAGAGGCRLLTLIGAGGCGKTRLALEVARGLLEDYPDGVFLVELAILVDPTLLARAVAEALGVREAAERARERTVLEMVEAYLADKQLLLLLDNCEHLPDACAELADALLRAAPELRILATSQAALGVLGELVWRVPSLSLPESGAGPVEDMAAYEAVQLFLERAQVARPGFVLTARNAQAVLAVCRRLDGIPLAIELAAARLRVLSVEQLAARLDDRFALLTEGNRTALPRQRTLRATLDWSYGLLGAAERVLLARLAVFVGGWTLEAAEAVCAGAKLPRHAVLARLDGLVHKSLVQAEEREGAVRYRLLESVRAYALEQLAASGELDGLRERHVAWCRTLAEEAAQGLTGADQGDWLVQLDAEHDNLRTALRWALEGDEGGGSAGQSRLPERREVAMRLAAGIWRFWLIRGHVTEGRAWLERLVSLDRTAEGVAAPPLRAAVHAAAAVLATEQGEHARAADLAGTALALYRALGDERRSAAALDILATTVMRQGHYTRAAALYEESLAVFRALDQQRSIATVLNNLGMVVRYQGDYARAVALYEESLTIKRSLGDAHGIAVALNNLGDIALDRGDVARARALFEQSLASFREQQGQWGIALLLTNLGHVARAEGDPGQAARLYRSSLELYREMGNRADIGECLEGLAAVLCAEGEPERATRLLGAAVAGRAALNAPPPPRDRAESARTAEAARAALGEAAFAVAWAEGQAMTVDETASYALTGGT